MYDACMAEQAGSPCAASSAQSHYAADLFNGRCGFPARLEDLGLGDDWQHGVQRPVPQCMWQVHLAKAPTGERPGGLHRSCTFQEGTPEGLVRDVPVDQKHERNLRQQDRSQL